MILQISKNNSVNQTLSVTWVKSWKNLIPNKPEMPLKKYHTDANTGKEAWQ